MKLDAGSFQTRKCENFSLFFYKMEVDLKF